MHLICGLCAPILKVCSTPPRAPPQKFFALTPQESPPRFLTQVIFLRKPSPSTHRAIFMSALPLTERFIAFHHPAKNPYSSIRRQNISGISRFPPTELST